MTLESFIVSATDFGGLPQVPAWRGYDTRAKFAGVHVLFEDGDLRPLFA